MLYFALMAASMGLQQLKAWQDNKQREAFAEKQMELKKALQRREFDRARRLQEEAAKIALEMEAEAHAQRRKDIENEYDNVFNSLIDQLQLDKWPLSVVPFIMKGESFGSHVRGFDVACVHCILTPSNDMNFNRHVYKSLDLRVEQMMNTHWNSNNDHPVVYYGGAWKPKAPNGVAYLDYSDVHKLHAELKSVPVICITPYFLPDEQLIFRVWVWGMGSDNTSRQEIVPFAKDFSLPLNKSSFVKPKEEIAQTEFSSNIVRFINETANYLTMMIGYLTDMYYWKMYNLTPLCKALDFKLFPNSSLKGNLVEDYYTILNDSLVQEEISSVKLEKSLSFYTAIKPHIETPTASDFIDNVYKSLLEHKGLEDGTISDVTQIADDNDIAVLEIIAESSSKYDFLNPIIEDIKNQIACNTLSFTSPISIVELLQFGFNLFSDSVDSQEIQFNIEEHGAFIGLLDKANRPINNKVNPQCLYVEYYSLLPSDRIHVKSNSFILTAQQLKEILNKISHS